MYDICIIGGGVAGLSAAITIGEHDTNTILIDKNPKLGKKIYATGNGKCNLTNTNMDISSKYHSSYEGYVSFINDIMGASPLTRVKEFMLSIGIPTYDRDGYIYPASRQASSVAWAMIDRANISGIDIRCNAECTDIKKLGDHFEIVLDDEVIRAKRVIIACGGKSYPSLGGSDKGYKLVTALGDSLTDIRPALCGVITDDIPKTLSGVRVNAAARITNNKYDAVCEEYGELQITDYGLSGIMIFNLSSLIGRMLSNNEKPVISINFIPDISNEIIYDIYEKCPDRTITGLFNGFLNDKLVTYILQKACINGKAKVKDISKNDIDRVIDIMSDVKFAVKDIKSYDQAQVCAGGVRLSDINPDTCESKRIKNLYYAGEIMDVDGVCGGYNITYAILSGIKAGEACIYDKN